MTLSSAGQLDNEFYSIRPDGIGLLRGSHVTFAEARAIYSDAEVSVELGNPGALWRKDFVDNSNKYYFIYRQNGRELFRAPCSCTPTVGGDWTSIHMWPTDDKTRTVVDPIAMAPLFPTDRGIRVGSKVYDLRNAYPELQKFDFGDSNGSLMAAAGVRICLF